MFCTPYFTKRFTTGQAQAAQEKAAQAPSPAPAPNGRIQERFMRHLPTYAMAGRVPKALIISFSENQCHDVVPSSHVTND